MAWVESPANGTAPVTDSTSTSDSAYTSVFASIGSPSACSGDAYRAVWVGTDDRSFHDSSPSSRAIPKSTTRSRRSAPNTIFDGVSSVWNRPF